MGRLFAVCSGSGGVGKTTVALALATGAAKAGKRTILLDASGPARCADLILGLSGAVSLDIADVASGEASMEAALYPSARYPLLSFACASLYDGVSTAELSGTLLALQSLCDVLVAELPTGQAMLADGLPGTKDIRIAVLCPDDAGIRACERLLSGISPMAGETRLLLNFMQHNRQKSGLIYGADTVRAMLDYPVLGEIPEERAIAIGAAQGRIATECSGPAKSALSRAVASLLASGNKEQENDSCA